MFTIAFKVIPQSDPSSLQFIDESTGDETVISRVVTITKSDLSSVDYPFTSPNDPTQTTITENGILDKDYALEATFTVTTNGGSSPYSLTYRFVTLGYTQKGRLARGKRLSIDNTIEDKEKFKKDTLDINYHMMIANDRVLFSDIVGSQRALDYIADILAKDANSPFSY